MENKTRSRILEYLQRHQSATPAELASGLGMTAANVRHHLSILEKEGTVSRLEKRIEGRGRPVIVFSLSAASRGDGFTQLAQALLVSLLEKLPPTQQEAALNSLAKALIGEAAPAPAVPMSRRLAALIEKLNELHYQARWEAGSSGPRIILGHCPYAAIIAQHPELCRLDARILSGQLGQPVRQLAKLERAPSGLPHCIFALGT